MKRLLIPLLAAIALPTAVNANVDPKVAEMCMKAVDFKGCVETMSGESVQKRMTIDQGISLSEGNSCPPGSAYAGNGYCREVLCDLGFKNNHDPILTGGKWKCKRGFISDDVLKLSEKAIFRATNDPSCPSGEPKLGWTSTCEAPYKEPSTEKRLMGKINY